MFLGNLFKTKSKKLYLEILLSFIILTFIIVLSTSFVFSSIYLKSIYEQLTSDSINSSERLSVEFDNVFEQLEQTSIYLRQSPDVYFFLISSDNDAYTINQADMFARQVINLNSLLHSIILYNKNFDFPIMVGRLGNDVSQFINGHTIAPQAKSNFNIVYSHYFSNGGQASQELSETISVIFPESDSIDNITDNAIIMTLDKSEIENTLLKRFDGTNIVTDNSGRIIFASDYNDDSLKSVPCEPFFTDILSGETSKGSFKVKLNNDYKIVTYIKSSATGLYLINFKSVSNYTSIVQEKEAVIIIISIIGLLIFLLVGYLLSKYIYSPINKVVTKISNSNYGKSNELLSEVAMISGVFEEAQEHIHSLEAKSEYRNNRLKEEFLRRLLQNGTIPESISNEIEDYNLNIEFGNLVHVSIRIDNYNHIEGSERPVYETTLCKTIPKLIQNDFKCETVNMYEGEIALLMNFKNTCENSFDTIVCSMNTIRNAARESLHITLTIGIGGVANSMEECVKEYRKAVEISNHRFVLGLDRVYYQKYLDESLQDNLIYPSEIEDRLVLAIKLNKIKDFSKGLDALIELLKNYIYPEASSAIFQIAISCIKAINSTTSRDNSRFYLSFEEYSNIFSELQTMEQSKEWLMSLFKKYQTILDDINRLKENKHYKIVEKMQQHIKGNYQDINLSVEALAELAGYTPYYFSRLFKEITGVNVNDYVRQIRITKAKELLGMPEYKINEIPGIVGFTTVNHFYSVFKKDVGLTPASFREYKLQHF